MYTITIITIVVVALLTVIIFGLTWLGFKSCLRMYQIEIANGKYDKDILKEYSQKRRGLAGIILSYLVLIFLVTLFIVGIIYKSNNQNITINNKTILVIKSDSMADYYDEKYANEWFNDKSLQFSLGDICIFEKTSDELIKGEIYGYKYKNYIITHRLININDNGTYEFRGDNNPISDVYQIKRESIVYHYTGTKIKGIGVFILYAQSYFGIWSIVGMTGVIISSEIVSRKINKWNKKRYNEIKGDKDEKK